MKIISKLSDECKKCKYKNKCDIKRMGAYHAKEQKNINSNTSTPITKQLTQPMLKIEHPITINMGGYGVDTSLEEIKEKLKKDFYKNFDCSFNK